MTPRTPASPPIPALVINLDRHPDRLQWFTGNARKRGLAVERIAAVDGKDPANLNTVEALRAPGAGLGRNELACIASHRLAWKWLLESDHPFVAVFEDDAHLSEDIADILRQDLVPAGIDIVKLEVPSGKVSFSRRAQAVHCQRGLHRLLTRAYGAGAYVISRRCAERLLELTERCNQPVDVILFDDTSDIWLTFPILQVVPAPCIQDVNLARAVRGEQLFQSTIEEDRQTTKSQRKGADRRRKSALPMKKLRNYIWCVMRGADPLRHRDYIAYDLGNLSARTDA
jgi:glycosyl transferase family 25